MGPSHGFFGHGNSGIFKGIMAKRLNFEGTDEQRLLGTRGHKNTSFAFWGNKGTNQLMENTPGRASLLLH